MVYMLFAFLLYFLIPIEVKADEDEDYLKDSYKKSSYYWLAKSEKKDEDDDDDDDDDHDEEDDDDEKDEGKEEKDKDKDKEKEKDKDSDEKYSDKEKKKDIEEDEKEKKDKDKRTSRYSEKYEEYDEEKDEDDDNHSSGGFGGYQQNNNDQIKSDYIVLAWNDLGMHCMDKDFSVFAILPPYNTLQAQVIRRGYEPDLNPSAFVYYMSQKDTDGSINTTSIGKTNFWDYVQELFNVYVPPNVGLKGYPTPNDYMPIFMEKAGDIYQAEGIPITPYDDNGQFDHYPQVKVIVKDDIGRTVATTTTVLPVSDEMTCISCHGSNSGNIEALPAQPENDPDPEKDYRWNILKKHDEKHPITDNILNQLKAKGYNYQASLYNTAKSGTPILCASCHKSNALPGTGVEGISPLTQAIHSKHAEPVANSGKTGRNACYLCHPGSETQCLRGAMGNAHIECQNCHGSMADVGSSNREGWFDMPTCQHCHQNGKRYNTVFKNDVIGGTLRDIVDNRFATKPDTPISGVSLYRFSNGHGGLRCEACHGSPHAIYPSSLEKENAQIVKLQGYKGTLRECFVCHKDQIPLTADKGPHGMHTIGQEWVDEHGDYVEGHGYNSCMACHGTDLRGSDLSKIKTTKTFDADDYGRKTFQPGHKIGCYDCHNGPNGD